MAVTLLPVAAEAYVPHQALLATLNNCSGPIGLNQGDIQFLSRFSFLSESRVKYLGNEIIGKSCEGLTLNLSSKETLDFIAKGQLLPVGVCNWMKKESQGFDRLLGSATRHEPLTCNQNPMIQSTNRVLGTSRFQPPKASESLAFDYQTQWPYLVRPQRQQTGSLPCYLHPLQSASDRSMCIERQITHCGKNNHGPECEVISAATVQRIFETLRPTLCPDLVPALQNDPNFVPRRATQ